MSAEAGTAEAAVVTSVQRDLADAVRAYVEHVRCHGELPAFGAADGELAPTDVLIAVSAMLEAVDVELFELALWQTWGRP